MRSRNDTFGFVVDPLATGAGAGIKPAKTLVVVFADAFKELNIEFDATASLIVVTAVCGVVYIDILRKLNAILK